MSKLREGVRTGSSMGGHSPKAHGKIRYIVRSFGKWAKGKQHVAARRLLKEHPEVVGGSPERANALAAWLKDQWTGTTKWRGKGKAGAHFHGDRRKLRKNKLENEAITARAMKTARRRFSEGESDIPLEPVVLEALYAMARRDGPNVVDVLIEAIGDREADDLANPELRHLESDARLGILNEDDALVRLGEVDRGEPGVHLVERILTKAEHRAHATVRRDRPGGGSFPIPDKGHARAALARINQAKPPLSPAERAKVIAKARAKLRGKGKLTEAELLERWTPSLHLRDRVGKFRDMGGPGGSGRIGERRTTRVSSIAGTSMDRRASTQPRTHIIDSYPRDALFMNKKKQTPMPGWYTPGGGTFNKRSFARDAPETVSSAIRSKDPKSMSWISSSALERLHGHYTKKGDASVTANISRELKRRKRTGSLLNVRTKAPKTHSQMSVDELADHRSELKAKLLGIPKRSPIHGQVSAHIGDVERHVRQDRKAKRPPWMKSERRRVSQRPVGGSGLPPTFGPGSAPPRPTSDFDAAMMSPEGRRRMRDAELARRKKPRKQRLIGMSGRSGAQGDPLKNEKVKAALKASLVRRETASHLEVKLAGIERKLATMRPSMERSQLKKQRRNVERQIQATRRAYGVKPR